MAHFWIFLLTVSGLGLDASSSVVVSALVVMVRLPVVTRQIPKNIYKGLYKLSCLLFVHSHVEHRNDFKILPAYSNKLVDFPSL